MKLGKLLAGTAMAALLGSVAVANATAIDFTGGSSGDSILIKFNNFEAFTSSTLTTGTQNFGIINITSIQDATTGQTIWSPGSTGQSIVGVFNGITISSITANGSGGFTTTNTGGVFDLFVVPQISNFFTTVASQGLNGYTNAGCAANTLCYNGITNVAGHTTPDLVIDLVPGVIPGDTQTTLSATTNTNTSPISGNANGDAQIVGGNDQGQLQPDLSFSDNFCVAGEPAPQCTPAQGNWPINSEDPVTGAIPEPGTLAIFGSALAGLGLLGWKRKRNSTAV